MSERNCNYCVKDIHQHESFVQDVDGSCLVSYHLKCYHDVLKSSLPDPVEPKEPACPECKQPLTKNTDTGDFYCGNVGCIKVSDPVEPKEKKCSCKSSCDCAETLKIVKDGIKPKEPELECTCCDEGFTTKTKHDCPECNKPKPPDPPTVEPIGEIKYSEFEGAKLKAFLLNLDDELKYEGKVYSQSTIDTKDKQYKILKQKYDILEVADESHKEAFKIQDEVNKKHVSELQAELKWKTENLKFANKLKDAQNSHIDILTNLTKNITGESMAILKESAKVLHDVIDNYGTSLTVKQNGDSDES